ncbi:Flp family type IVb pilin [Vibrio maritimus]|jgi:pilus assembly protein Flp/PilA
MSSLKTFITRFIKEEDGLSVVEYVLGGALIILALGGSGAWNALSTAVSNTIADAESGGGS